MISFTIVIKLAFGASFSLVFVINKNIKEIQYQVLRKPNPELYSRGNIEGYLT